jgi:hypothetical protein
MRRERFTRIPPLSLILCVLFFSLCGLSGCSSPAGGFPGTNTVIDWVNFVRFGGITYIAVDTRPGRALARSDLGPVFATVQFKLEGNVHDPGYQTKDGDAAFLAAGSKVYTVKGYRPTFRLAAQQDNGLTLYEADTNPHARKGGDLLDIEGKVRSIGILSEQDAITELGAIKDRSQVAKLVDEIVQAPVDQKRQGGDLSYFLAFHLFDGTVVKRTYWPDTGILERGILLPASFGQAIKAALPT